MTNPLAAEYDAWTGDPATDRAMLVARAHAALDYPQPRDTTRARDERPTIGGGGAIVVVPESIARTHNISGGGLICIVYPDNTEPANVTAYIDRAHAIAQSQAAARSPRSGSQL